MVVLEDTPGLREVRREINEALADMHDCSTGLEASNLRLKVDELQDKYFKTSATRFTKA